MLKASPSCSATSAGPDDLVFRIGGEEFAVLCPLPAFARAAARRKRIRLSDKASRCSAATTASRLRSAPASPKHHRGDARTLAQSFRDRRPAASTRRKGRRVATACRGHGRRRNRRAGADGPGRSAASAADWPDQPCFLRCKPPIATETAISAIASHFSAVMIGPASMS